MFINKQTIFALVAISAIAACENSRTPENFGITVSDEKFQTQADLIIKGKSFTPGGSVTINLHDFPRKGVIGPLTATVSKDGTFERREEFAYGRVPRGTDLPQIKITVRDNASGHFVATMYSPYPFVVLY